jgi:hypothetical protein
MKKQDRLLQTSETVFRRLLCLYPRDFRLRFGREMLLTFRDRCREEMWKGAGSGLTKLWMETLLDFAITASAEHLERRNLMRVLAEDFSWDILHVFRVLLKCTGWTLGGIATALLAGWVLCSIYVWYKQPLVMKAWEQATGATPDLQFQSLLQRHPKADSNETTRKLERIVRQLLGPKVVMPTTNSPELGQGQLEPINSLLVSRYVDRQIRRANDQIDPAPPEISNYLQQHAMDFNGLYQLLNSEPTPRWETDYSRRLSAPIPNLRYFRPLLDVIAVDSFEKMRGGEMDKSQDAIKASWKISQSLLERPELISQLTGLALLKVQAGILRKAEVSSDEWVGRLNLDLRNSLFNSLRLDSAVVFLAFRSHEGEIRSGSAGVEWWGHYLGHLGTPLFHIWGLQDLEGMVVSLHSLQGADFCSFDPDEAYRQYLRTKLDLGEGTNYVPNGYKAWKSATLTTAELELTREIIKLKATNPSRKGNTNLPTFGSGESALCSHIRWNHISESDGSVTIKANRLPAWLEVEAEHELPLNYTIRND